MADEITIHEHAAPTMTNKGVLIPTLGPLVTSQVLDLAVKSAAFNASTRMIRITTTAVTWLKIGDTDVSAAANANGNIYMHAGDSLDIQVTAGQFIDSAADV